MVLLLMEAVAPLVEVVEVMVLLLMVEAVAQLVVEVEEPLQEVVEVMVLLVVVAELFQILLNYLWNQHLFEKIHRLIKMIILRKIRLF